MFGGGIFETLEGAPMLGGLGGPLKTLEEEFEPPEGAPTLGGDFGGENKTVLVLFCWLTDS